MKFGHISWKWVDFTPFSAPWDGNCAWAAPERKHKRNQCFSYTFLGVPGTEKCVSGWIFTKNAVSGASLVKSPKLVEFRGIPPFSLNFQLFGVSRGPGPPEGMEFTCIIRGFARSAGSRRKCWFYMFNKEFTHSHGRSWVYMSFLCFSEFSWKCMKFMSLRVLPRPGSGIACITVLFYMFWGARFAEFPSLPWFSWNPLFFMNSP